MLRPQGAHAGATSKSKPHRAAHAQRSHKYMLGATQRPWRARNAAPQALPRARPELAIGACPQGCRSALSGRACLRLLLQTTRNRVPRHPAPQRPPHPRPQNRPRSLGGARRAPCQPAGLRLRGRQSPRRGRDSAGRQRLRPPPPPPRPTPPAPHLCRPRCRQGRPCARWCRRRQPLRHRTGALRQRWQSYCCWYGGCRSLVGPQRQPRRCSEAPSVCAAAAADRPPHRPRPRCRSPLAPLHCRRCRALGRPPQPPAAPSTPLRRRGRAVRAQQAGLRRCPVPPPLQQVAPASPPTRRRCGRVSERLLPAPLPPACLRLSLRMRRLQRPPPPPSLPARWGAATTRPRPRWTLPRLHRPLPRPLSPSLQQPLLTCRR